MVSETVNIPVIAHGGARDKINMKNAILDCSVDALSLSSTLHYNFIKHRTLTYEKYESEGNIEFLKKRNSFKIFGDDNIHSVKKYLSANQINVRRF